MFSFLRGLIKTTETNQPVQTNPEEAAAREKRAKEEKLLELSARLTDLFRKDPLQVVGAAFLIEVVPKHPEGIDRSVWETVMRTTQEVLTETAGPAGLIRRVGAIDYFARFGGQFRSEGVMNCEWAVKELEQKISGLGIGEWQVRLSAALPAGSEDSIQFVLMKDLAVLRLALKPLLGTAKTEGVQSFGLGENEDEQEASNASTLLEGDPVRGLSRKHIPVWNPDDLWDRIFQVPEWQEQSVHGDEQLLAGERGMDADDQDEEPPETRTRTPSAADRVREAESKISNQIEAVTVRYQPLWDMSVKKPVSVFAVPALAKGSLIVRTGDNLFGRGISATASGSLDRKVIGRTWREICLMGNQQGFRVILPVHLQTLESTNERQVLFSVLKSIADEREESTGFSVVIVNVPKQNASSRLSGYAQAMKSFVDDVWVEFSGAGADFSSLNRANIARVGFNISGEADENELIGATMSFAHKAKAKGFETFVRGYFTQNTAQGLPACGIDHLAGDELLADPKAAISSERRFNLEAFLSN